MSIFEDINNLKEPSYLVIAAVFSLLICGASVAFFFYRDIFVMINPLSLVIFASIFCIPPFVLYFPGILGYYLANEGTKASKENRAVSNAKAPPTVIIITDILFTDFTILVWLTVCYLTSSGIRLYIIGLLVTTAIVTCFFGVYAYRHNIRL